MNHFTPAPTPSNEALIQAARGGDEAAFASLLRRHYGLAYAIALARLRDWERAEDLTQEVFLRAYLHLDQVRPDRFPQWLSQVTRNLAVDWGRKRQRAALVLSLMPQDEIMATAPDQRTADARDKLEQKEQAQLLMEAIEGLPPEQREVILLHYTMEMKQSEIARLLDMHPVKVGRRMKKALKSMRGTLEPLLQESAPKLKPSPGSVTRTLGLIAAVSALPTAAKAAMVSQAGGATVGAAGGLSNIPGAALVYGLFQAVSQECAITQIGGSIMLGNKVLAAAAAATFLTAGGVYYNVAKDGPAPAAPSVTNTQMAPQKSAVGPTLNPAPAKVGDAFQAERPISRPANIVAGIKASREQLGNAPPEVTFGGFMAIQQNGASPGPAEPAPAASQAEQLRKKEAVKPQKAMGGGGFGSTISVPPPVPPAE